MNKLIKQAFTLIELLVVIAIIGILSGLIIVSMSGVTQKATIAKAQVFNNSLRNALMLNLVSEWKFDELITATEGTSIQDSWGGINNGILDTYISTVDPVTNKISTDCISGKCLSFDGVDDYVYISGSDSISSNLAITGAITLSVWTKFNDIGTNRAIMGRGRYRSSNGDYGYGISRRNDTNAIKFDTYSTTTRDTLDSLFIFNDSSWHLITATWDGTTNTNGKKIYIDGILDAQSTSLISTMGQPSYQFMIGVTAANTYFFNGLIDDVRIYNMAISISQIKEQYYAGLNSLLTKSSITKEEYNKKLNELAINLPNLDN